MGICIGGRKRAATGVVGRLSDSRAMRALDGWVPARLCLPVRYVSAWRAEERGDLLQAEDSRRLPESRSTRAQSLGRLYKMASLHFLVDVNRRHLEPRGSLVRDESCAAAPTSAAHLRSPRSGLQVTRFRTPGRPVCATGGASSTPCSTQTRVGSVRERLPTSTLIDRAAAHQNIHRHTPAMNESSVNILPSTRTHKPHPRALGSDPRPAREKERETTAARTRRSRG
jgi:hypothetical protein